jgi:hypothetical protein
MRKAAYIFLALLAITAFVWVFYLNEVVLPEKVRELSVAFMEGATGGSVHVGPAKFNIVRGVVLSNVLLNDGSDYIFTAEDISCGFVLPALFKRRIIVPSIKVEKPVIYLKRAPDGAFNISKLITEFMSSDAVKTDAVIRKILIHDAKVRFIDRAVSPEFAKDIDQISAEIGFDLPHDIKFSVKREADDDLLSGFAFSGSYDIAKKRLEAKASFGTRSPEEFEPYYAATGLKFEGGSVDIIVEAESADNEFHYGGVMDVEGLSVKGVDVFREIHRLKGRVELVSSGMTAKSMDGSIFGIPVKLGFDYSKKPEPSFTVKISSDVELEALNDLLRTEFNIDTRAGIEGAGKVEFEAGYSGDPGAPPDIKGSVSFEDASVTIPNTSLLIEGASGLINFTGKDIKWSDVDFVISGGDYVTSGRVKDIKQPEIEMSLSSKDMRLDGALTVKGNVISFSRLSGKYLNSVFDVSGSVDISDPAVVDSDLSGIIEMELKDLPIMMKWPKDRSEKIRPSGVVHARFALGGDIRNLKSCEIDARISGGSISLCGLKMTDAAIDYLQNNGLVWLKYIRSSFYGGTIEASVKAGVVSKDTPWTILADLKGVRIEKLKADTQFKDKDISGILRFQATLNGYPDNNNSIRGTGKVAVINGKLWQLNLFNGLGMLLFTSDFDNVLFKEGSCSFFIQDGAVFTNDIALNSDMIYIYGRGKLGPDNTVKALLKAELTEEALMPGMRKNITDAIGNYTIIEIGGTLKDPKFRPRPDVGGMIENMKDYF